MLKLSINGELKELACETLEQAIEAAGFAGEKIAAAVNGEFVPKALYAATAISDGDQLDIVKPVGGG